MTITVWLNTLPGFAEGLSARRFISKFTGGKTAGVTC